MQRLIVDSDFLVANYKSDDSLHETASRIAKELNIKKCKFYCLNVVVQESTTVVSKKMGMDDVRKFYPGLRNFINTFIIMDENLEKKTWDIFLKQTKKGTSFVDCANLAAIEKYKFDGILSFDKFYPKELNTATFS